jgi:hypothetical protein
MKKIILVLSLSIALFSCSKNSKQIEASKKELLTMNVTEQDLKKYKFDVIEAFDKDIYKMISSYYEEKANFYKSLGENEAALKELGNAQKYVDMLSKANGKTFYKVHALRIAGDTLNDKTFFLDDKNNIIDFINKK